MYATVIQPTWKVFKIVLSATAESVVFGLIVICLVCLYACDICSQNKLDFAHSSTLAFAQTLTNGK